MNMTGMMGVSRRTSKSPTNSRPQSPARAQKRKIEEREPGEIIRSPSELTDVHPNKRQAMEEIETVLGTEPFKISFIKIKLPSKLIYTALFP